MNEMYVIMTNDILTLDIKDLGLFYKYFHGLTSEVCKKVCKKFYLTESSKPIICRTNFVFILFFLYLLIYIEGEIFYIYGEDSWLLGKGLLAAFDERLII